MDPFQGSVYEGYSVKVITNFKICDIAIREYIDKVGPGSRKDALGLLLAACDDNETRLSYKELVGAASIFLVAGIICQSLL